MREDGKTEGRKQKMIHVRAVPCEIYSRIVGYFRPVSSWNEGKQEEFRDRKTISLKGHEI